MPSLGPGGSRKAGLCPAPCLVLPHPTHSRPPASCAGGRVPGPSQSPSPGVWGEVGSPRPGGCPAQPRVPLKPVCRLEGPWQGVKTPSGCQVLSVNLDQVRLRVEVTNQELHNVSKPRSIIKPKAHSGSDFCLSLQKILLWTANSVPTSAFCGCRNCF